MKGKFILLLIVSFCCSLSQCSPVDDDYNYINDGEDYNPDAEDYDAYAYGAYDPGVDIFGSSPCECDDIFDDNCACKKEKLEPIECFNSPNEIDNSIFNAGDTRQAFEDCKNRDGIATTCEDYATVGFVCAPSWTCQAKNNTIITDGDGLIDVRDNLNSDLGNCALRQGILDSTDTKCLKENEVCCKNPNLAKKSCGEKPPEEDSDHFSKCGRSLDSGLKITGGNFDKENYAQPGEFPHMCIVFKDENGRRLYVGGASLISRNKLLTVAHKFWLSKKGQRVNDIDSPHKFFVRCGEQNVKSEAEVLPHQETQVIKIHIHPDYNPRKVKNNLVILEVVDNFVYQKHIGPVCLPGIDSSVFEGETECWSSGWGADAYSSKDNTKYSDNLKKIKMPVIDLRTCEDKLRQHPRLRSTFRIHKSWICVGGKKGTDTCTGDGGSPHVCKGKGGEFIQVGAVNWGLGCGEAVPSVYSSVPDAMCWIDKVMSCLPQARQDIDISEDYDIRGAEIKVKSVNKLTSKNCYTWNIDYEFVLPDCIVEYEPPELIDERNIKDDDDDDDDRGR